VTLPELVDSLVSNRLLVLGSLPPEGRDLDLLVPSATEPKLCTALGANGFSVHGGEWVRFRGCSVDAIDVVPADSLELEEPERRALFAEALPLDGLANLARPAPHFLLLLLARRYRGGARPPLEAKRRRRIERALSEDPDAWERARERATAWHGRAALDALEAAYRAGPTGALAEEPTGARRRLGAFRRAPMIAFSGLDGSGKTSQVEALEETLRRLGFDVAVEWTRLEWTTLWEGSSVLDRVSAPFKRVLRLLTGSPVDAARTAAYGQQPEDAAAKLRQRSPLITHVWVLVVAAVHAAAQRRAVLPALREGKVVICDRYTLDAAVHLRERYGPSRRFRYQRRLLEWLSPRPIRSYLVDAPAPVALARKPEHFDLDALTRQATLYREMAAQLGVRRVDGTRAREDLCTELAYDVWSALRGIG
jgi:thymidylate kinase